MGIGLAERAEMFASARNVRRALSGVVVRFARSSPLGAVSGVVLVIMLLVAVFADRLAPYDPIEANYAISRHGPMPGHPLGADHMGRDVWRLARVEG